MKPYDITICSDKNETVRVSLLVMMKKKPDKETALASKA
jgi:hypothetical protein